MANEQQIIQFKQKFKYIYIDSPPLFDKSHKDFIDQLNKEETPEKLQSYKHYISETFRYYGEDTINWILEHDYSIISCISTDTRLLNMYKNATTTQEKNDIVKLMTPSLQYNLSKENN